ncbi:MAG TPA: glutamate-5-semialdehyde dehydrogenase [Porphyromonadaceae bacterium]|jgi:glutamate-5-semialdehyde dehydrogenase|nr:glutamate-5-semialdehyde dehydrogenase [Porphyromonadaceae bacterium]
MDDKQKNNVLKNLSELLRQQKGMIMDANRSDMLAYPDMDASMRDRLKVDENKIEGMIRSLEEVAAQADPEGRVIYEFVREDGLRITNRTVPFGTILIIYESRPDVTIEAAATAFKAGNRILLKGGKESTHTNLLLTRLWQEALTLNGADKSWVTYLHVSREETRKLIRENSHNVDLIIPRGGEGLIRFVQENTSVPVIVSGRGNNFLYIDADADFDMAVRLVINGKKRISVCNAIDKVAMSRQLPELRKKITMLATALQAKGIEVWGNREVVSLCNTVREENDAATLCEEYLAPKIYLTLVDDLPEATAMINRYSGGHSAVIVTRDAAKAGRFMQEVDCAAVYHNASSRFTDGGQFGVGAEIAISTQKLHFRGPLGAQELVTNKWFVYGEGHIRE